jgi:hypothetical protein
MGLTWAYLPVRLLNGGAPSQPVRLDYQSGPFSTQLVAVDRYVVQWLTGGGQSFGVLIPNSRLDEVSLSNEAASTCPFLAFIRVSLDQGALLVSVLSSGTKRVSCHRQKGIITLQVWSFIRLAS